MQTPTSTGTDAIGQPGSPTWADTYTGVRCRVYGFNIGKETLQKNAYSAQDFMSDFLPDQAIDETMRVVFDGKTYEVVSSRKVFDWQGAAHHVIAYLRLIR